MSSNKTIFLNTIFLYFRMILTIGISLYTTRVVYNALGVENFGLFNLIAGFVVLFTFINSAMRSGTQRYLNIGIASDNKDKINDIFCTALNIHIIISIIILILLETFGLWFLNNKLNFSAERIVAANIVYQCAIATTIINIISIPYQSIILAKEKMKFYAYIGIFEALAKLATVFLLIASKKIDVLILYSFLLVIVAICITSFYYGYVFKNFRSESKYQLKKNKQLTKEMITFSGWNLFGQVALLSSNQGISILFNIFFGVTINASLAIANQVTAVIHGFSSNLQTAFNPQIVQTYAKNNIEKHIQLVISTSKYSLFLMSIIAIPVILNTEYLLHLWLGNNLSEHIVFFTKIVILIALLDSVSGPFWMSIHAIGNIKKYQLIISGILLLNLPISYILLTQGVDIQYVFFVSFIISFFILLFRFFYFKIRFSIQPKALKIFSIRIFSLYLIICLLAYISPYLHTESFIKVIIQTSIIEILLIIYIFSFGLSKQEFNFTKNLIFSKIFNR